MSIDHNRIKVADLEKNQPNKILITNSNGELEFSDVDNLEITSPTFAGVVTSPSFKTTDGTSSQFLKADGSLDDNIYLTSIPNLQGYAPLDEFTKLATSFLNTVNDLTTGGSDAVLTAEQGKVLQTQINGINAILNSDDINLDTLQEIVDAIKDIDTYLATILVNDLTTGGTTKALTAEMGKTLKGFIDALEVNKDNRFRDITIIPGITYTFTAADFASKKGKIITNANPVTLTVPINATVPISIGSEIVYTQEGDGVATLAGAGITFVTNLSLSMVKGETRVLRKIDTDTWTVSGNIAVPGAKVPNTYFVNSVTGNNATGVYEDASHPFATIDYVLGLGSFSTGSIIYLQSAGSYQLNGVVPRVNDISIVGYNSGITLDFSGNSNSTIMSAVAPGYTCLFKIDIPNGTIKNDRSGGTGVVFSSYVMATLSVNINVRSIYWNTSSLMTFLANGGSTIVYAKYVTSRSDLHQIIDNDVVIENFTCLAACTYTEISNNTVRINNINGAGAYVIYSSVKHIIGNSSCTGGLYSTGSIDVVFDNSVITNGSFQCINAGYLGNSFIRGVIKSCPSISQGYTQSGSISFIDFIGNFGAGVIQLDNGAALSFENCSIKCNSSLIVPLGYGTCNTKIKNTTIEMVTPAPLMSTASGVVRTIDIGGLSTNATMISNQIGTGVTVTQMTNY